jgi:UDP-N-acetylglucosamine 2-epimerase (non-hydrolysing)/GDP/UDP-N,N'-diacetylbacillosamine 2-epimerase (hydrolysing)
MIRTIAVVTTSRADYSHLRWVLHDLDSHPQIDLRLIVVGAQLTGEFGQAAREIERDGLRIDESVECLLSSDSDVGMAKTIGALSLRIPIAHIEGGEVSEGAIDDAVRNALTKMSHLHFVPTAAAKERVLAMGEESWRVHRTGAPSLDHLRRSEIPGCDELQEMLGVRIEDPALLVAYHPVTIARDTLCEADVVFEALERLEQQVLFCFPNSDAGSRGLIERAGEFCASRSSSRLFVNLNPRHYWGLLGAVGAMVGNSSSGIMESASIPLPTVNIGVRQQGRERAGNIIDVPVDSDAIVSAVKQALDPSFSAGLRGLVNPYGSGDASKRIVDVLADTPLGEALLLKRALPLRSTAPCDPPE